MKNCLTVAILFLFSFSASAVNDSFDEFDLSEPAVEINSSKEDLKTNDSDVLEVPQTNTSEKNNFPDTTGSSTSEDDTVLVRTREEPAQIEGNPNDLVELRMPQDVFLPYKQRQFKWGFLFSLGSEQVKFPDLISQLDDATFADLFGKNGLAMLSLEMGPKYNTSGGAFAILAGYSSLNQKKYDAISDSTSKLSLTRTSINVLYYLDTLFPEPYFVPYIGGGVWQADYAETSTFYPGQKGTYTTDIGTEWRVGALFGLDWIERDAARVSRRKNGFQGTFLNVYALSTMMSESNPNPNLNEDLDLGASIVVEF